MKNFDSLFYKMLIKISYFIFLIILFAINRKLKAQKKPDEPPKLPNCEENKQDSSEDKEK